MVIPQKHHKICLTSFVENIFVGHHPPSLIRMLRAIFAAACVAAASAFTAPAALPGRVQAKRATATGEFASCGERAW